MSHTEAKMFDVPSIGCDGDGFFVDSKGTPVSVIGKLGGEKGNPQTCEHGGYLEDCVAFEINPEPVPYSGDLNESAGLFARNIHHCLRAVNVKAQELKLKTKLQSSMLFPASELLHPDAQVSGCSASYDAWSLTRTSPPNLAETRWRFASGDIHVGWPNPNEWGKFARVNVARVLDLVFYSAMVAYTEKDERANSYGKPGIHRPTPYGVEYKSVSNFWMTSQAGCKWAYKSALKAMRWGLNMTADFQKRSNNFDWGNEPRYEGTAETVELMAARWDRDRALYILEEYEVATPPASIMTRK